MRIALAVAFVIAALLLVLASSDAHAAALDDVCDLSSSQSALFGQAPIAIATGAAEETR
jgi:hypothetical protein